MEGEAGSCSSGLTPCPSGGGGQTRLKGLDAVSVNSRKPQATAPSTPMTRARKLAGKDRPRAATSPPNNVSIRTQSIIEPSWLPQTPVTL